MGVFCTFTVNQQLLCLETHLCRLYFTAIWRQHMMNFWYFRASPCLDGQWVGLALDELGKLSCNPRNTFIFLWRTENGSYRGVVGQITACSITFPPPTIQLSCNATAYKRSPNSTVLHLNIYTHLRNTAWQYATVKEEINTASRKKWHMSDSIIACPQIFILDIYLMKELDISYMVWWILYEFFALNLVVLRTGCGFVEHIDFHQTG